MMITPSIVMHNETIEWHVRRADDMRHIGVIALEQGAYRPIAQIGDELRWLEPTDTLEAAEAAILATAASQSGADRP